MSRPFKIAPRVAVAFVALPASWIAAGAQTIGYTMRFPAPNTHIAEVEAHIPTGGARGYTPEQFVAVASSVAGSDLAPLFHALLATTDEMDSTEALDWFGLKFAELGSADPAKAWALVQKPDATPAQQAHLRSRTTSK